MKEVSTKTLNTILAVGIVITLGGIFFSLFKLVEIRTGITGFAGTNLSTGIANLSVQDVTQVNVTALVDFGTGYVLQGYSNCTLVSNGTANVPGCSSTFASLTQGFVILNIGNNGVFVNISFNATADTLVGGAAAMNSFAFQAFNASGFPGCEGNVNYSGANGFQEIDNTLNYTICPRLNFTNNKDGLNISIFVRIPDDAKLGEAKALMTVQSKTV